MTAMAVGPRARGTRGLRFSLADLRWEEAHFDLSCTTPGTMDQQLRVRLELDRDKNLAWLEVGAENQDLLLRYLGGALRLAG